MPNHGKGGRKPERGVRKTGAVAVRTTPELKAKIEAAALENGRSTVQEIEHRLEASLSPVHGNKSAETEALLVELAQDIGRAEALTGKRWHKDLRTWAMVREALGAGAIERNVPKFDRFMTDADESGVGEQQREILDLTLRADYEAETLAQATGLAVALNPLAATSTTAPRYDYEALREAAKGLADNLRPVAELFIGRIESHDAKRRELAADTRQTLEAMAEAINEGVMQWNDDLQRRGFSLAREYRPSFIRNGTNWFPEPTKAN